MATNETIESQVSDLENQESQVSDLENQEAQVSDLENQEAQVSDLENQEAQVSDLENLESQANDLENSEIPSSDLESPESQNSIPLELLVTPDEAVDTQRMTFNENTGQPYDPSAPSVAEEGVKVDLGLDTLGLN